MKHKADSAVKIFLLLLLLVSNVFAQEEGDDEKESTGVKDVETREINVAVGIDKVVEIDFPFDSDLILADKRLVNVKVDLQKQKLTFVGVKEGNTSLTLKDTSGEEKLRFLISVTTNDQSKVVNELRELLQDIEGLEVGIKGGKVYVGGYIVVPGDIGKVATVLASYPEVLRLVEMHPQTQIIIAKKMTEELSRFNLKTVTVRVVNSAFWVEGVVGSTAEDALVKQITQAYMPEKIESLSANSDRVLSKDGAADILYFLTINKQKQVTQEPLPKQVKISTQFVELSKDYSKVFGFKWSPLLEDGGGTIQLGKRDGALESTSRNTFSAVISNLIPKIRSLKNAGYGRVLQSGMLVTKEGKEATINKTTTVPFVLGENESARASNLTLGFSLAVTPAVLPEENIDLSIVLNVGLPSGAGTNASIENKVKTQMVVKSGQSAVVGGVVQSQDLTSFDKDDPAKLADADANNAFFNFLRSKSKALSKNQYVVFVTPELIQSASQDTAEIRRKFRRTRK